MTMGRVSRPSHPPIASASAPARRLPHLNVSGASARGPLLAVQERVTSASLVGSITGLYRLLSDLQAMRGPEPAATLDLIGPSTGTGLLQLGSSVIDAGVHAVHQLFDWIGREHILRSLGVKEVRLVGSRTAIEPAAHETMRRLAQLVGVPVSGTTTLVHRDHFRDGGLDWDIDATMVCSSALPPRKVPPLWPETAVTGRTRELGFDAIGIVPASTLTRVPWPRFVVPRGFDTRTLLGAVRVSDGRCLPGLLALPRCEILLPMGRVQNEESFRVVEVLFNWEGVRITGPELPDGAVYPVVSPQRFVRLFIGLPQYRS
jgi:hypothetical protein